MRRDTTRDPSRRNGAVTEAEITARFTEFGELARHFNEMSQKLRDGYAALQREISERKAAEARLAHDAFHDNYAGGANYKTTNASGTAILALDAYARPRAMGIIAAGIVAAYLAARQILPILNPVTFLFRQADRPALTWIQEHVPTDGTILINPFLWGSGLYAGSDGGYWITPLTGRKTLPPPVLYGLDTSSQRVKEINQLSQQVIDRSQDAQTLYALLQEQGIRYIYIGVRGGVLSADVLQNSPQFSLLYHGDGTWVFQVK